MKKAARFWFLTIFSIFFSVRISLGFPDFFYHVIGLSKLVYAKTLDWKVEISGKFQENYQFSVVSGSNSPMWHSGRKQPASSTTAYLFAWFLQMRRRYRNSFFALRAFIKKLATSSKVLVTRRVNAINAIFVRPLDAIVQPHHQQEYFVKQC